MAGGSGIETNRIRHFVGMTRVGNFFPGACTECHKTPSEDVKIMACSGCRLVWYCGKECQKKNWTYHKEFCKAASSLAEECKGTGSYIMENAKTMVDMGMNFSDYLNGTSGLLEEKLTRKLDKLESRIMCFQKVCEICKVADFAVLKPCKICYMVFYCSKEHANQDSVKHSKFCPEYTLVLQCYRLLTTQGNPFPGTMPFKITTVRKYKRMLGSMKDYIKPTFDSGTDACLSDWVSYPLSLLYALEHTNLKDGTKKICDVKELTVLMYNAANSPMKTMEQCYTWEYMFHFLPKLKKLNILLYEPNNELLDNMNNYRTRSVPLCSECIPKKCELVITLMNDYKLYKSSDMCKKADVIYNHLMSEIDVSSNIPSQDSEIPVILMGVDKKMMQKKLSELIESENYKLLMPLRSNPFRGMRPNKLPKDIMEDGSFLGYQNSFIVGLQSQVKRIVIRIRHPLK